MKINFAEIKFRPSLLQPETKIGDLHKQLANAIWQQKDIAAGKFALKLFDNPEVEVSEEEKAYIKEALETFVQWVKTPVLRSLGENSE